MKKIFLPLAALAFVATGALTVTSCGSEDPIPTPEPELPVVDAPGTLTYKDVVYPLDTSKVSVEADVDNKPKKYNLITLDNDTILASKWLLSSWTGDFDNQELSKTYVTATFFVPFSEDGKFQKPTESEKLYLDGLGVFIEGNQTAEDLGTYSEKTIEINALTQSTNDNKTPGIIDYKVKVVGSENSAKIDFKGDSFGIFAHKETTTSPKQIKLNNSENSKVQKTLDLSSEKLNPTK